MNSWIVVSDASRARVFEIGSARQPLRLLRALEHPKSRLKNHDLVTDDRGRTNNGMGRRKRSVMESRTPPKQTEEQVFAREVTRVLKEAQERNEFAALALVAPPRFTGMLRETIGKHLGRRIIATVEKDLTSSPPRELSKRLSETIRALRARAEEASTPHVRSTEV
jgi:protein required for attachment to host cells